MLAICGSTRITAVDGCNKVENAQSACPSIDLTCKREWHSFSNVSMEEILYKNLFNCV